MDPAAHGEEPHGTAEQPASERVPDLPVTAKSPAQHLKIESGGTGYSTHIWLDGVQLTTCRSLRLEVAADGQMVATLELVGDVDLDAETVDIETVSDDDGAVSAVEMLLHEAEVPFKARGLRDAHYLRYAAKRIESGHTPGGSNVTEQVVRTLRAVAALADARAVSS